MLFDDENYRQLLDRIRATPEARSLRVFEDDLFWIQEHGNFGYVRFVSGDGPRYPEVKFDLDGGVYSTKFKDYWAREFGLGELKFPARQLELPEVVLIPKREMVPEQKSGDRYWAFEKRQPFDIFGLFTKPLDVDSLYDGVYLCFQDLLTRVRATLSDDQLCDRLIEEFGRGHALTFMSFLQLVILLKENGRDREADDFFRNMEVAHGGSHAFESHYPRLIKLGLSPP